MGNVEHRTHLFIRSTHVPARPLLDGTRRVFYLARPSNARESAARRSLSGLQLKSDIYQLRCQLD